MTTDRELAVIRRDCQELLRRPGGRAFAVLLLEKLVYELGKHKPDTAKHASVLRAVNAVQNELQYWIVH